MKRMAYPLALLAFACIASGAQAASQQEFKDIKKFARENAQSLSPRSDRTPASQAGKAIGSGAGDADRQARDGLTGDISTKKVGGLDVSKFDHSGDIGQQLQVDINSANSPRTPAAIGQAVGSHASEGND